MNDDSKKSPEPEDLQDQLKKFFKDKMGGKLFSFTLPQMGAQDGDPPEGEREEDQERDLTFDRTPQQVKEYLDRYVIGQEEAKKVLSVAVCDHYNHVRSVLKDPENPREYVKQNVILLGPTGVGKTYLVRTLAQLVGVPFVKADITKFSETGYVGGDVDDLVRELLRMADGDVHLAECGIIFLDEIDKIATSSEPIGRDVSGRGVQTGLLKLLEETEVPSRSPFDMGAQLRDMMQQTRGRKPTKGTINTKHILFVVSGAFSTMPDIIEKRLTASQVGFGASAADRAEDKEGNLLKRATTQDFIEYGFEPEFIGRLPIRVALDDLDEEDFFRILKHSEGSIVKQYRMNFDAYGIEVAFLDEGLRTVAKRAIQEKTGARGLVTVLEETLRDFKFYLPGSQVTRFAVTQELVENPADELMRVTEDPDYGLHPFMEARVRDFEEQFRKSCGIEIEFDESAVEKIVALGSERGEKISEFLESTLSDYVYGLRIIQDHTGRDKFTLTAENLENPRDVLDGWVKEALRK